MRFDTRGFRDPFEALRRQRAWQLDEARSRLAGALAQFSVCEAELHAAVAEASAQAASAADFWRHCGDPHAYGQVLLHLTLAGRHRAGLERRLASIAESVECARAEAIECQRGCELLERHCAEALAAHGRQQSRKEWVRQDHQWSSFAARGREGQA